MFISFAGIDGSGKTTQIQLLEAYFQNQNTQVFVSKAYTTKEKELFGEYMQKIDQRSILFLFQAFHVEQYLKAKNALEKHQVVIADRWDESYLAYHSTYGVLYKEEELRERINLLAFQGLKPDVCFLMDIDPHTAIHRTSQRGQDYFDKLSFTYHSDMVNAYRKLATEHGWVVLYSNKKPKDIHQEVIDYLRNNFK